ncbi:MAG: hypothetical protein QF632_02725 [Candidatus Woesearchaeota archaeon]|jgi:hypothetical protein|nr:hypothetical protein [Candidatus Woesearchaeota archaeon]MDP7323650.1 hypothetical protein [Candidatus Woesearchaeota archaeon]MDP7457739.1 hypothetical protein [Candidatus Woesearchaeota archaeon]|tara:strand:+ start:191 stop:1588 length:1398 start_codon:yes stop_codon:yes gene_type:complete
MVRVGRVVIEGKVRDITQPGQTYTFDFSRYVKPWTKYLHRKPDRELFCIDAKTEARNWWIDSGHALSKTNQEFLRGVNGFEAYNVSFGDPMRCAHIQTEFDVLRNVDMVYAHPDLNDILSQLGISSLTPFLKADEFGLESTGEKVEMEVMRVLRDLRANRSATFEQTILLNGEPYFLDAKGGNFGGSPLDLDISGNQGGDCRGGLPEPSVRNALILGDLNRKGYGNVVLIAAYTIPGLKQYGKDQLGMYVRAVKSSSSISHHSGNMEALCESLGMSGREVADYVISGATSDMAMVWKNGYAYKGPAHEQNIRIRGLSDFSGSEPVNTAGFPEIVHDVSTLVFSCQKIMHNALAAGSAAANSHVEHYATARNLMISVLNNDLGLSLPEMSGTMNISAEVYNMQAGLGLVNPNETIGIVYDRVFNLNGFDDNYWRGDPDYGRKARELLRLKIEPKIVPITMQDLMVA